MTPIYIIIVVKVRKKKLLFIGAISSGKGFIELMDIWSYLASSQVDLELSIAGSIHFHKPKKKLGDIGVADQKFESNYIKPWMENLPNDYQPNFLGGLTPKELQQAINQSWAVIVNPSWYAKETFCVSAVEAQACNKTVFSVATGGLQETVYRGNFKSLATDKKPEALGKLILDGLSNIEIVSKNGKLAGDFVRSKFSLNVIRESWIQLLSEQKSEPSLPTFWQTPKDSFCDLMRWSRTGVVRVDGGYYPSHLSFRTGRATFTASRLLDNLRLLAFCPYGYNRDMTRVLLRDS